MAREAGESIEQAEYPELRTHCPNPGCAGRGLKGYGRCLRERCCGVECQRAQWSTHKKPECTEAAPKAVSKGQEWR